MSAFITRHGVWLAALCSPLAVPPTSAQQPLPQSLSHCVAITSDAAARLACFDREIAKLAATGGAVDKESAAARADGTALPPSLTPEQKLGLSKQFIEKLEPQAPHSQEPSEFHAHIAHTSNDGFGHLLFVLDDAQIWRQVEADPNFIARSSDAVKITVGALGSYWLSLNGRPAIKVKRLR